MSTKSTQTVAEIREALAKAYKAAESGERSAIRAWSAVYVHVASLSAAGESDVAIGEVIGRTHVTVADMRRAALIASDPVLWTEAWLSVHARDTEAHLSNVTRAHTLTAQARKRVKSEAAQENVQAIADALATASPDDRLAILAEGIRTLKALKGAKTTKGPKEPGAGDDVETVDAGDGGDESAAPAAVAPAPKSSARFLTEAREAIQRAHEALTKDVPDTFDDADVDAVAAALTKFINARNVTLGRPLRKA